MTSEMRVDSRGRTKVRVGPAVAAVLSGADDVSTWDDEELLHGRRRNKYGKFKGGGPVVVPAAIHSELTRRRMSRAHEVLRENVVGAVQLWALIMSDPEAPMPFRMDASKMIAAYVLGKPTERIEAKVGIVTQVEELPWVQALKNIARSSAERGVVDTTATRTDGDIVDAEVIEDNPLCACGCGQPPRSGSAYLNGTHQRHAESRTIRTQPQPQPAPSEDDLIIEDDDDFVEESDDPDDPVLTED